jgi:putative hydrolase of the HAD superfamily
MEHSSVRVEYAGGVAREASLSCFDLLVFDCDDTLYPLHLGVRDHVRERIRELVGRVVEVSPDAAQEIMLDLFNRYGTTLRGLITEYADRGVSKEEYWSCIHGAAWELIPPNPRLVDVMHSIPKEKCFIFSNGDDEHLERVLKQIGLEGFFEDPIVDVKFLQMNNKPSRESCEIAFGAFNEKIGKHEDVKCMFFEDSLRNLLGAKKCMDEN